MNKEKIIDRRSWDLLDQMPGAIGCKDENSTFIYCNEAYSQLIGIKDRKYVIGISNFDIPCEMSRCAHLFQEQDRKVIQTLEKIKILDVHPFPGGQWKTYLSTKIPLLDREKNVIGAMFQAVDITNTTSIEIGALLARVKTEGIKNNLLGQDSYMIGNRFCNVKLTEKQSEILFYLLRGKSAKKTALILKLSNRTVEEYIENLKNKFTAFNKSELIDKAICHGFLNIIPESIFRTQLSLELKDW